MQQKLATVLQNPKHFFHSYNARTFDKYKDTKKILKCDWDLWITLYNIKTHFKGRSQERIDMNTEMKDI